MPRPHELALAALAALAACRDVNRDHCLHRAADPDAWCAKNAPTAPFCSPCALENHGCVAAAPTTAECPAYEPDTDTTDTSPTP